MDLTFGFGATGSLRFIDSQLRNIVSMKNDFLRGVRTRDLDYITTHKFAVYGKLHYQNIADFVDAYIRISYLHDFPQKIETYEALSRLLTHLVFESTIKHRAMNGEVTWHILAIPFTSPALWKPIPAAKLKTGQSLDPLTCAMPKALMPATIGMAADSESLYSAYKDNSFASESVLSHAINEFISTLKDIDGFIAESEGGETWPYEVLRPGKLPYYEWI